MRRMLVLVPDCGQDEEAVDFPAACPPALVQRFSDVWAKPSADALAALCTEDVRLVQPARPPIVGRVAAHDDFARLLQWQPGLHAIVDDWAQRERIFISLRLRFRLGGRMFELPTVDRILVRDGLIAERTASFDALAFAFAVLKRPSEWVGFLRYCRGG
jgi:ketosteroid isomerase-like protein